MKSKERQWVLTKEGPIYEVQKDHEGLKPKKKEKEINNMEKRRGSWSEDMQQGSWARPEDM